MHSLANYASTFFVLIFLFILFHKKVRNSPYWRATATPLASIIGSGFLISGPFLFLAAGKWSILAMALIIILSFFLGSVIRFNIQHLEPYLKSHSFKNPIVQLETISKICLGFAYIISVSYYLKLLSGFALMHFTDQELYKKILTTCILIAIGFIGKIGGLNKLEEYEVYTVNLKLAIIFTLLVIAFGFNINLILTNKWVLDNHTHINLSSIQHILGFLIIIQGFETSRFLNDKYNRPHRKKTSLYAQCLAGFIYITFMSTTLVLYKSLDTINETSIIHIISLIAPILGPFLLLAAVFSQFSAAIADTAGGGGLLAESFRKKLSIRNSYLIIILATIVLTWLTNIYEIVAYASKGFALYYGLETFIALLLLKKYKTFNLRTFSYIILLFLMITVIVLGKPVEGVEK